MQYTMWVILYNRLTKLQNMAVVLYSCRVDSPKLKVMLALMQ